MTKAKLNPDSFRKCICRKIKKLLVFFFGKYKKFVIYGNYSERQCCKIITCDAVEKEKFRKWF